MTVIAWDGQTLAADKQSTSCNLARVVTKIYRVKGGLIGISGSGVHGAALLDWFRGDRQPDAWPYPKMKDDVAHILYIDMETVAVYNGEAGPFPEIIEDERAAVGSGRDYALAAMYLGKTAREAVEIACHFDVSCGMGIDVLTLDQAKVEAA